MKCLHLEGIFYFVPMAAVCFNGDFFPADAPLFPASNRAFRYGDALFETGRVEDGKLLLADFHFERLFSGLQLLQISIGKLDKPQLLKAILEVCSRNGCADSARVRLQVFRDGEGCAYCIEAESIVPREELSAVGYNIAIFPDARKAIDAFSHLKSSNYLPYVIADLYAQKNGLDEAIVLNAAWNICDGSRTNIFIMKRDEIITPGVNQGCVAGVMRRHVIESLQQQNILVDEAAVAEKDLLDADAIFLTNAVRGIRWVAQFNGEIYQREPVERIWNLLFQTK